MESETYNKILNDSNYIDQYLEIDQSKPIMRFITCGSVDDGKSTLIGRMLYDSKLIFEDQLDQLVHDSKKVGTRGSDLDFALIVDGLGAEQEQGITIDVAYRFFATEKRKFIVADTPGHEQYTRNMATGASTAELAIILIDARKGVRTQTCRHTYICHLLGIRKFVLAVNKMDLVEYSELEFNEIVKKYSDFTKKIGIKEFTAIPISGINGDNIVSNSQNTNWYKGRSLIKHLESVDLASGLDQNAAFHMPVQWVNRANLDFRGFTGTVASGQIQRGDTVRISPSGKTSKIKDIITFNDNLTSAVVGQSITLTLIDEIDCSRGQIISSVKDPLGKADQFETSLIWMDDAALVPGRAYYLKIGTQTVSCIVKEPKFKLNVNTLEKNACKQLGLNEIGVANITTDHAIPFTPYSDNRTLGGFILIDKLSNTTAAAGLIHFALRRSQNIYSQIVDTSREHHAKLKNQKPKVLWMTGLSGSGKSTIANEVEKKLAVMKYHTFLLDGDNIRHGLNKDLGFTEADRIENIRRIGEVSKLMADAGLIVIVAFISPFRSERDLVRDILNPSEFIEIFIDTPLEVAEKRDVKGLYAKARNGQLKNFTGIDSPYEAPVNPEIHIDTTKESVNRSSDKIVDYITSKQFKA